MSGDEWLELSAELGQKFARWTPERSAALGVELSDLTQSQARQALTSLISRGVSVAPTAQKIRAELRRPTSKWEKRIEARHLDLFPNGCPNEHCGLCWVVDMESTTV